MALSFRLWTDRHFSGIDRARLGVKGEPDPVSLPRGPAEIHVRLIRGTASETEDFAERVRLTDWPLPGDWSAIGNGLQVRIAIVPLAAVIAEQDGLTAAIRRLLNA